MEVAEIADAPAALKLLGDRGADVVVAGEKLPGNAGLDFFALAEQRHPGVKKILLAHNMALSGLSLSTVARSLNQTRVDFFLVHPFAEAELTQAVDHVLNLRKV